MMTIVKIKCNHGCIVHIYTETTMIPKSFQNWREARRNAWKLAYQHGLAPLDIKGGVVVVWGA